MKASTVKLILALLVAIWIGMLCTGVVLSIAPDRWLLAHESRVVFKLLILYTAALLAVIVSRGVFLAVTEWLRDR